MPYEIDLPQDFQDRITAMPHPVREDLLGALREASRDPFLLPALLPGDPRSRILAFAEGHGLALVEVDEEGKRIALRLIRP
ncbi:hypothetical protein [Peterkaempfera sp. SMS 1(5)a]|uniref:hypothetical protein n=1 Tax=Peterkaempfera podocarpi TaxID=3232308 RepID=UPI0036717369